MRSVVITGVSRGLGAALFDEFNAAGDRILAVGRRFTDEQHTAERVAPQRIRLRQADLVYPGALPSAAELSSFVHDATDLVLVHNAAVIGPVGAIGTLSPQELQTAVAVNLTAPMLLTNALLGAMGAGQQELTVLFISSGAATKPVEGWSVYGATKLAGESFFESLASQHATGEGGPRIRSERGASASEPRSPDLRRIRAVNVNPGGIDTHMQERIREYATRAVYFPDRQRFLDRHEQGQLAAPATVARRILAEHLGDLTQR